MTRFFSKSLQQVAVYQAAHSHRTAFIAIIGRDDQGVLVLEVQPYNLRVANGIWSSWRHIIPHFDLAVMLINEYTYGEENSGVASGTSCEGTTDKDSIVGSGSGVVQDVNVINFPEVVRRWMGALSKAALRGRK